MVISRPFGREDDLSRLKQLVTACMFSDMQHSFWHVGDLVWGMYQNTLFDPRQNVRLWENEAGELIGFAWREKHGAGMQVAPQHRHDSELLGQMVTWGEMCQREAVAQEGAEPVYTVSTFEDNFPLLDLLAQQGFQRDEFYMLHMRRDLSQPIPEAKLPEGWVVSVATNRRGGSTNRLVSRRITARLIIASGYEHGVHDEVPVIKFVQASGLKEVIFHDLSRRSSVQET
jgi:hypothetical protein